MSPSPPPLCWSHPSRSLSIKSVLSLWSLARGVDSKTSRVTPFNRHSHAPLRRDLHRDSSGILERREGTCLAEASLHGGKVKRRKRWMPFD